MIEMDFNSDDSAVNLDDDRDVSYSDSSSSHEMTSGNDIHSDEGNESIHPEADKDEENDVMDTDVRDGVSRRIIDLTNDDIRALEFASEEHAFNFYFSYAKCQGFAMRKDDVIRDKKEMVIMRQYLCSRAGLRDKKHLIRLDWKKEHRPLTRTNCLAKLRVRFDYKTGKWKVVSFEESHNHDLTPAKFVPLIPNYRGLIDGDKAQVDALHSHGIRPCQIMGFLVDQKGGYRNVGFSKKDFYNYIDEVKRGKIKDGDAVAGLSYLQGKADNNPMEYRYKELFSDFNSIYFEPVLTTSLQKIERQASKVFTLDIFKDVKYEIERAGGLNVIERSIEGDNVVFKLKEYCKPRSERFVVYDKENSKFVCDCRLFESCGIPCRHIFCVMRLEHIDVIPPCMICNRWRKDDKSDFMISDGLDEVEPDMMRVCRFVVTSSHCNSLCDMVSQKREHFKEFINDIMKLKQKYERLSSSSSTTNVKENVVQDPTVVKKKGAPMKIRKRRKSKRCSNCNISGHVITTCPRLFPPEVDEVNINDEDHGPESQTLRRDAAQNDDGISSDENFPDSSSNHVSGSNSHSQSIMFSVENRPTTDKRNIRKKKIKSLSQISNSVCEVKPSPTEVLKGPHRVGGDTAGPSSTAKHQVEGGVSVNPPVQNGTFSYGYHNNVSAPSFSYQLPIVGPSSVGNIQIREGMSITLPFPNSFGVPVLPSQGSWSQINHGLFPVLPSSMHHGLFPLFPNQSTVGLNYQQSTHVAGIEDASRPGVWNDLLQEVIRKSVCPSDNSGKK
ncbi:Zinc finger, PMZ-type [Sesbania bispinosa]|nr:Zinc finger, PMZ-type [Sesbania bispinosa]